MHEHQYFHTIVYKSTIYVIRPYTQLINILELKERCIVSVSLTSKNYLREIRNNERRETGTWHSVPLKASAAYTRDVGRGVARIDYDSKGAMES
jgi:hypothetical protein